jgi:hypothetical protein
VNRDDRIEARETLLAAAYYLEIFGWRRGSYDDEDGRCCVLGAIYVSAPTVGVEECAVEALSRVLKCRYVRGGYGGYVARWNDLAARGCRDVVRALRRAADEARYVGAVALQRGREG